MKYKYIQNSRSNTQLEPQVFEKIKDSLKKHRIGSDINEFGSEKELVDILSSINKSSTNTIVIIGDDKDFDLFIGQINKIDEEIAIGYIPLEKSRIAAKTGISNWQNAVEAMAQRKISEKIIYSVSSRFFFDEIVLRFHSENLQTRSRVNIKTDNGLELTAPSAEFKFENLNEDKFLSKSPIQLTAYHNSEGPSETQTKKRPKLREILEKIRKSSSKNKPQDLILSIHSKNFKLMAGGEIKDSLNRNYKNNLSVGRTSRTIRLITQKSQQLKDAD